MYLNYYYNIINDYWTIPEKSKQEGLRTYFFEKKNRSFYVCHFTLETSRLNEALLLEIS